MLIPAGEVTQYVVMVKRSFLKRKLASREICYEIGGSRGIHATAAATIGTLSSFHPHLYFSFWIETNASSASLNLPVAPLAMP